VGEADSGPDAGPRWDVALSFAGAQRAYVGQVAAALKVRGVRCFYDDDEQVRLWGTHLAEELPRIYARESAAVVVFVSAEYAGQDWTRLERRAAFSRAVAEAGVYVLPARFDDCELPGLLPDVAAVDLRRHTPGQFADLVVAKLADLGVGSSSSPAGIGRAPAGAVRVSQASLRRLGVHAAITVPGVPVDVLPEYVPRDADAAEFGVRARVAAAAQAGGFVLLVGGSSVGKTRCAAEAVFALVPDWWLVHPSGPAEVAALAAAPTTMTVVWLDELQRYLDGEYGLTGGMVRALLSAPGPVVIIGTLWPDRYAAYTAVPGPGSPDLNAREREVLDLAAVVRIGPEFSPAEQNRARAAAARDRRLRVALESAGYGLTQTLAAAPQLVARWQDARDADPYAWAVLTAALDAARLGTRTPLSAEFLRAAAPGYCTPRQQAEAPGNWFEQALAYTTATLYGAAAALAPAGTGMGRIGGYTVADYLIQYASRERRTARVPASTWDAALSHIRNPDDAARFADSARNRLLYRYAIPLYQYAADVGGVNAAEHLAELLANCGDLDTLRARADAGDRAAAVQLAMLMGENSDLGGAAQILYPLAHAGDVPAAQQLAELMVRYGCLDEAARILRSLGNADDEAAAWAGVWYLADFMGGYRDLDGLRARADVGDEAAAQRLAGLLAERGDLDGAIRILRAHADADDRAAVQQLAELLDQHGDLDEALRILRPLADAGDGHAAQQLAGLLAQYGDLDGLRARADVGDGHAAGRLAGLLAERGDLDGATQILRAQANAGDRSVARKLRELLIQQGRGEEAEQLRRFGLNP
jgi:hypothetical protein